MTDNEQVDPVASGVARAADSALADTSKGVWGLITRVLGPSADVVGDHLAEKTKRRVANAGKFAEAAARKGAIKAPGEVNARVAHAVLEDGTLFDGEIAAEYFGGMLAGSKTLDGKNDTAVSWAATLASMSSMQIRLHFLLYREWAARLSAKPELNIAMDSGRRGARLAFHLGEVLTVLCAGEDLSVPKFEGAVIGLVRLGLIADYGWGPGSFQGEREPYGDMSTFFMPTAAGFELYGWAQGVPNLSASAFAAQATIFDTEPSTPRLLTAIFLSDVPASTT